VLLQIFSGLASGLSDAQLEPFIQNMHTALWALAASALAGAAVSMLRPAGRPARSESSATRALLEELT
jgi:hypothetical protein